MCRRPRASGATARSRRAERSPGQGVQWVGARRRGSFGPPRILHRPRGRRCLRADRGTRRCRTRETGHRKCVRLLAARRSDPAAGDGAPRAPRAPRPVSGRRACHSCPARCLASAARSPRAGRTPVGQPRGGSSSGLQHDDGATSPGRCVGALSPRGVPPRARGSADARSDPSEVADLRQRARTPARARRGDVRDAARRPRVEPRRADHALALTPRLRAGRPPRAEAARRRNLREREHPAPGERDDPRVVHA